MFRRVLTLLGLLLTFTCAMRLWQYQAGVRLQIFDILLLGFLAAYGLRALILRRVSRPTAGWRQALGARWIILLVSLLTIVQVDFQLAPLSTQQFAKGFFSLFAHTCGLTALALWLLEGIGPDHRALLRTYAAGAVAASVYSFAEVSCAYYGFDLGKAVFATLSTYPPDFDLSAPFYYPWENFFRAVGFTGVNSQATYTASVVPLLLVAGPFRHRWVNFLCAALCLAGTALTLSRNGFFTLCLAAVFYLMLQPGLALRVLPRLVTALIPIAALFFVFQGPATQLLASRLAPSVLELATSRSDIVRVVWPVAAVHPLLGHGLNQYSVIMAHTRRFDVSAIVEKYPTKDEAWVRESYANVHNNWLNWFFEGGGLLVAAQLAGYMFLLRLCWRSRTPLGLASTATLCSLLVSGMFNMTLDLFSTELLFFLLPLCVTLEARSKPTAAPAGQAGASHPPC